MGHKKVQVVVLTKSGPEQVLLLQTNARRGSFWQNVTGSVEKGETFEEAAIRELLEETGLKAAIIPLELEFRFTDQFKRKVKEECFLAVLDKATDEIELDPSEHQSYQWKKIDDVTVHDYKYASNFEALTKAILSIKKTS